MNPFKPPAWLIAVLEYLIARLFGPPKRPPAPRLTSSRSKGSNVSTILVGFPAPQSPGNVFRTNYAINAGPAVVVAPQADPVTFTANPGDVVTCFLDEIDVAGGVSPDGAAATLTVPPLPDVPPLAPAAPTLTVVNPALHKK